MPGRAQVQLISLTLCFAMFTMVGGCAGRKITTAVGDQAFVAGPPPRAPVVEEATATSPSPLLPEPPPSPTEPPREQLQPLVPPEIAKVEPPVSAKPPVRIEPAAPAPVEAPPIKAPPVEEVRVEEQPITPAPPPPLEPVESAVQPMPPPPPPLQPAVPPRLPASALSDVYFDFDRFSIRADAQAQLETNAGLLKSQGDWKVLIEGHCDERGTTAYNLVLGERRAQAVKQYLLDLGVSASQIQITSYGKERPFCGEHSEACWQSNRRAHFMDADHK